MPAAPETRASARKSRCRARGPGNHLSAIAGLLALALMVAACSSASSEIAPTNPQREAGEARSSKPVASAMLDGAASDDSGTAAPATSTTTAVADAAPPSPDARPRIWSVGQVTWIRPRPRMKDGEYLGYVRTGSSIALRSTEKVAGTGCTGGFYQVEPRGLVCDDRTVTQDPPEKFRRAAEATRGSAGTFPYRYAFSDGAPMYNRIPTVREQARFERAYGPAGVHPKLPKSLRAHEELATDDVIEPADDIPDFLKAGGSAKEPPYDLVARTIPHGSMLSFTRAFAAEGRTWLLSADHTVVPADRVRQFRPSTFHGVEVGDGRDQASLPIAWIREKPRAAFTAEGDTFEQAKTTFETRTWVGLTGARRDAGGKTYLETKRRNGDGTTLWIEDKDATVVELEAARPFGVKEGQKWVVVRLSQGTLVAYDDLTPVFSTLVSPGAGGVPVPGRDPVKDSTTPTGTYLLTFKDRAQTMSPDKNPDDRTFWIQDVPYTQYFNPPFALHGAYWHERFGEYVSAGCVNMSPLDAERLFAWTDPPVPSGWQGATGAGAKENGLATAVVIRR